MSKGFGFNDDADHSDDSDNSARNNNGRGDSDKNQDRDGGQDGNPFGFPFGGGFQGGGNNPFGFGFGFSGPGDANQSGNNQSGGAMPGGSLGDILNQFGSMLSGMGGAMQSPEGQGAVNYALAMKIAKQKAGAVAKYKTGQDDAVRDCVRLVDLWLDDATDLPVGGEITTWTPTDWLDQTLPFWKRCMTPIAEELENAQLASMPEEARAAAGPLLSLFSQMGGMNMGMQLGGLLGALATDTVMASELGLPVTDGNHGAILPHKLEQLSQELGAHEREVLIYLCAREAAHQRLFKHVPWLVEQLILSVETFAAGLTIDTSAMDEATRELNPEMLADPTKLQEAMERMQGMDFAPKIVSSNEHAGVKLTNLISLVEGWVDYVVAEALGQRIPETAMISAAWSSRRAHEKALDQVQKSIGLELRAEHADQAAEMWQRLTTAVGSSTRDTVWDHPDFLPTADDVAEPAEFIDSILARTDDSDFDPIGEIEKLANEGNSGAAEESGESSSDDDNAEGTDSDSNGSSQSDN